jgi:hypothetical protein
MLLGQGHCGGSVVRAVGYPPICPRVQFPLPPPYLHYALFVESVHSIPKGFPSSRFLKLMPFSSKALFIASWVLIIGVLRPFSKSLTVDVETLAMPASSSCDQSSQALAALHCSGFM